jgi:hypothetical protein
MTKATAATTAITEAADRAAAIVAKAASDAATTVANAAVAANQLLNNDIGYIKQDIKEIKEKLDNKYVTVESFDPVRRVVYGLVGVVLVAVAGALIALVIRN